MKTSCRFAAQVQEPGLPHGDFADILRKRLKTLTSELASLRIRVPCPGGGKELPARRSLDDGHIPTSRKVPSMSAKKTAAKPSSGTVERIPAKKTPVKQPAAKKIAAKKAPAKKTATKTAAKKAPAVDAPPRL